MQSYYYIKFHSFGGSPILRQRWYDLSSDYKTFTTGYEIGQMYRSFQLIIEKLRLFMSDMDNTIAINQGIYKETMDKLKFLVSQSVDTSSTTQKLSAGMEETAASYLN